MKLRREITLKIILIGLVLGLCTDILARQTITGLNFFIFALLWTGLSLLTTLSHTRKLRLPLTYAALALINAFMVFWRASALVQFWSVWITLVSLLLLAVTAFIENYHDLPLGARLPTFLSHFKRAVVTMPDELSAGLSQHSSKKMQLNQGIVGAVGLGLIFMLLFASADQVLGRSFHWVNSMFESIGSFLQGYDLGRFFTISFWTVLSLAALLLLLNRQVVKVAETPTVKRTLTARDAHIILWTLVAIFAVFVALQLRYLFAGGSLPDGLTYATYAHRGYGQLLVATMLASAVIKYVLTTLKTTFSPFTKYLAVALVALNSIVILSAWKRLSLYEATYGWTMTRFVARLGLVCILFGSVALVVWLWGKLNSRQLYATGWYILVGVLMFAAVLNPEGIIARKNITERPSRSTSLDTGYVANLSPDAWPTICVTAPDLRAKYINEYRNLKNARHMYTPTRNHGLSRHHTATGTYTEKYVNCLR